MVKPTCPKCERDVSAPYGWYVHVLGRKLVYVMCSACGTVLGVVPAEK